MAKGKFFRRRGRIVKDVDMMYFQAMSEREKTIHNERVKYGAAALDRFSTGFYLVGGITPTLQIVLTYSVDVLVDYGRLLVTFAVSVTSIMIGFVLHRLGYQTLGDLK